MQLIRNIETQNIQKETDRMQTANDMNTNSVHIRTKENGIKNNNRKQ